MNNYQTVIDMQDFMDELGVYVLTFDRTGYGESDPKPKRPVKIEAFDIQELANQLNLGHKFDVIGISILTYLFGLVSNAHHTGMLVPVFQFFVQSLMHFCFHIS
ncbi:hypothetical protein CICLE_v10029982mg [Citrus x clementina]|uniref:AB hydrolase-1 domain-containing protein n=1 Tax=Citrus clementina TaxID=85681 RepID=V4SF65_CITCL|nr:hypothetical protein CICLE_v10029982mg [Citrus x clementina]